MDPIAIECVSLNINIWESKDASLFDNKITGASCALIVKEKNIFVIFKYTDSMIDWIQNLKFYPKKIEAQGASKIRVHRGHLLQYESIEKEYKDCLQKLLNENSDIENIIFTGFSLGGSLCKIAAWDNIKFQEKELHCYCFGASNVGNKHFVKEFNKIRHVQRIVFGKDPVPIMPFRALGYARTKNPLHIVATKDKYKFEKKDRSTWVNAKILGKIIYSKVRGKKIKEIKDHSLERIEESVQQ